MKIIELSIRVTVRNPKLETVITRKATASYLVDKIIGVLELVDAPEGEPKTQLLTMAGPVDSYSTYLEVLGKISDCK